MCYYGHDAFCHISMHVPLFSIETAPHEFPQSCLDTWFSQLHIIFHAFAWLSLARTGLRETLLALGKKDTKQNRRAIERQVDPCQGKEVSVRAADVHQIKSLFWNVLDWWLMVVVPPADVCQLSGSTNCHKRFGHRIASGCHKPTFYWKY